ncbi:hypothetical protein E1212_01745 [Jiangella ureilytica]|uniref:DUF1579 domain-containing protein n=1 Tax=Jiangella ureilytica TaxID=2530374 RepID=A0A4R4S1W8_9ACTN|nr:hypothetical protein [Jiangella ureilytica]TDC56710.1 hypothetical protein E1212_01745 [Jiangella ureilytica]
MENFVNPRLARLDVLVGAWEVTSAIEGRVMSRARSTFRWLDAGGFLAQRTDPQTYLVPEWQGAAPEWTETVIGLDDYSGAFTMLLADARGVCRTYGMGFEDGRWTLTSRPGEDFHQRFEGTVAADGTTIDGRWEASPDGRTWSTDFTVGYRRLAD